MTRRFLFAAVALTLTAAALAPLAARAADKADGRITDDAGKQLTVHSPDGKPIVVYMYVHDTSTKEITFDTAKVFHHVVGPDGEMLTKGPGGKFPHHRGIYIGWNKLQLGGKTHDLWHVRNTTQKHREFATQTSDATSTTVASRIDWIGTEGKPVLDEVRTVTVRHDDPDAYVVIDFTSELTAAHGDVKLGGDPEHAGLQYRPANEVADNKSAKYTFHADKLDLKKDTDLPWVALTYKLGDQLWTVQQIIHPENPKGAIWSAYRDYGRFGSFPAFEIPAGETATMRARFRITQGAAPSRDALNAAAEQYRGK